MEIKFHELALGRKKFEFFQGDKLRKEEKLIYQKKRDTKNQLIKEAMENEQQKTEARLQERIEAKKNLVVAKNIRNANRSRKPDLKNKQQKKTTEPLEI